jgi:hypothetical protein
MVGILEKYMEERKNNNISKIAKILLLIVGLIIVIGMGLWVVAAYYPFSYQTRIEMDKTVMGIKGSMTYYNYIPNQYWPVARKILIYGDNKYYSYFTVEGVSIDSSREYVMLITSKSFSGKKMTFEVEEGSYVPIDNPMYVEYLSLYPGKKVTTEVIEKDRYGHTVLVNMKFDKELIREGSILRVTWTGSEELSGDTPIVPDTIALFGYRNRYFIFK